MCGYSNPDPVAYDLFLETVSKQQPTVVCGVDRPVPRYSQGYPPQVVIHADTATPSFELTDLCTSG
jgi:hypothetical protein